MNQAHSFAPGAIPAPLTRAKARQTVCNGFPPDCNGILSQLRTWFRGRSVIFLANAVEDAEAADLLGLANELILETDGWVLIPYADSAHSGRDGRHLANASAPAVKPITQRFDRASAELVVKDFKSTWSRLKRAIIGLPIFKGHPDVPQFAKRFTDRGPRGTIADMETRDRGLALRPVLTEEGADLVDKEGWSAFSPYWPSRLVGEENGRRVYSPFKLISIGLLPPGHQNIPGLSLANAAEPDPGETLNSANENETTMIKYLIELLASLGITAPAGATETQLAPLVEQAKGVILAANAKDTEITKLKNDKQALEGQLTTATSAKDTAANLANAKDAELVTTKQKLATERTARAKLVVLGAVKTGRVTAADVDSETLALANAADFDAAATAIEARTAKLHTESGLGDLGKTKEAQSRSDTVLNLVNAKMEDAAIKALPAADRYNAAFTAVETDPKNAALFAAMKKPGSAA